MFRKPGLVIVTRVLDVDVLCKIKFTGRSEVEPVAISSLTEVTVNTLHLHLPRLETVDAGLTGLTGQAGLRLDLLGGDGDWQSPAGGLAGPHRPT